MLASEAKKKAVRKLKKVSIKAAVFYVACISVSR